MKASRNPSTFLQFLQLIIGLYFFFEMRQRKFHRSAQKAFLDKFIIPQMHDRRQPSHHFSFSHPLVKYHRFVQHMFYLDCIDECGRLGKLSFASPINVDSFIDFKRAIFFRQRWRFFNKKAEKNGLRFQIISYHVSCFQFFPKFCNSLFCRSAMLLCTVSADINDQFPASSLYLYGQVVWILRQCWHVSKK